jgi:hypothetical protein
MEGETVVLRFKQFSGTGHELEPEINRWLQEYEPDVTQMTQTEGHDGGLIISFIFEESFRGQELRLSAEHRMTQASAPASPLETMPDEPLIVDSRD